MMKPVTIVILATLAIFASACTSNSQSHPSDAASLKAHRHGGTGPTSRRTHAGGSRTGNTPSTLLLGHLIMRAPASWRVTYSDAKGDYTVSTGRCDDQALLGSMAGSRCPSFSMIVGVDGTAGPVPADQTYLRDQPYHPSSGVLGCPGKPATGWQRLGPSNSYHESFAHVSTDTAYYTVWRIGCGPATSSGGSTTASFYFEQRDWYLPGSRTLIVDEYSIPGLTTVLADATMR